MNRELTLWVLMIAGSFLSGSVMYSKFIPMLLLRKDVCEEHEDHNPGAANVFASCGIAIGLTCLLLDVLKGFIPVLLARRVLDTDRLLFAAVLAAPVLGHAIAPFNRFHGGKCIATSFGVTFALMPESFVGLLLAAAYILFSTVLKIPSHRRRSIFAFSVFGILAPALLVATGRLPFAVGCLAVALTTITRHWKRFCILPEESAEGELSETRQ